MIFPVWHLRHFRFHNYDTILHLRHFRFYTYVTSGFIPTSLFYTYVTSGLTTTSLPVSQLRHFFTPTFKRTICQNFHFSYTYSRCLRNLTSQSDSTPNFDLFKKKYQKRIIRHSFAKTFSKTAPKIQSFKTPFFSIIERFQRFPKNFLKTKFFEMCIYADFDLNQ